MELSFLPLLRVQRDLYSIPRGMERFRAYLRAMLGADWDNGMDDGKHQENDPDIELPLTAMNPMGKDHLAPFLDELLAMDAEGAAAQAVDEARAALNSEPGRYKLGLVVSDDKGGGWTNRYANELKYRLGEKALYKRGWITALLWTGDAYTRERVGIEVSQCVYRITYIQGNGYATTLKDLLVQEGWVMRRAGTAEPLLTAEELAYTRDVVAPYLANADTPTLIAALFGDEAARELGHAPLGLSARAGLALAREMERIDRP